MEIHTLLYFRIIVVENPFLKFVDLYHHFFVNAPRALAGYMEDVIQHWLTPRIDKLSKDKGEGKGEKYFDTSDLEESILTFRQFINFIAKSPSETVMGMVNI